MSIFSWDGISEEDLRKEYDLYLRENSPTASPYYNQDLIVNMDYIGVNNNKANKQGWERNAKKYWEAMLERYPNAFSSSNRFLIENYDELKVSPKCDQTFIDYFGVNEYTQNIGQVLVHHHIGQNGQVVAIPKGWHEGGENAAIHRIEYNLGVTHNAEKHSDKVQEALDANYIQSGNDVWCELKNGTELRTIAKNKFEYIQELRTESELLSNFPSW